MENLKDRPCVCGSPVRESKHDENASMVPAEQFYVFPTYSVIPHTETKVVQMVQMLGPNGLIFAYVPDGRKVRIWPIEAYPL